MQKVKEPYIWRLAINFRFSDRKSQSLQKVAERITYFVIQLRLKSLIHFTNRNSLNIIRNILPQHSQENASGWCHRKPLNCSISRRPKGGGRGGEISIKCRPPLGRRRKC